MLKGASENVRLGVWPDEGCGCLTTADASSSVNALWLL
jgi:hypothetical protein